MDYKKRLESRVEQLEAQVEYLSKLPFSADWREAFIERAVVCDLQDELKQKRRLLRELFPVEIEPEDAKFWAAETPKLY